MVLFLCRPELCLGWLFTATWKLFSSVHAHWPTEIIWIKRCFPATHISQKCVQIHFSILTAACIRLASLILAHITISIEQGVFSKVTFINHMSFKYLHEFGYSIGITWYGRNWKVKFGGNKVTSSFFLLGGIIVWVLVFQQCGWEHVL